MSSLQIAIQIQSANMKNPRILQLAVSFLCSTYECHMPPVVN